LRLSKLDRDAAGLQLYARRKILKPLMDDLRGSLHQQLGCLHPLLSQPADDRRHLPTAPDLVISLVALGKLSQVPDELLPLDQSIGAHTLAHAGSDDLLGASASNPKQQFDGRAIHKRAGKRAKFLDDAI
jgi:hypothetical protein